MKKNLIKPDPFSKKEILGHMRDVFAVVLIWRGSWYVLDNIDSYLFGGTHILSSIGGILFGLFLLYYPDKDLKELKEH